MEIDSTPVPPPQEYSDCPAVAAYQSESSMNFDYLHGLNESATADMSSMDHTTSSPAAAASSSASYYNNSPRHFSGVGSSAAAGVGVGVGVGAACYSSTASSSTYGQVDDSRVLDRFVTVLDQLDARVEKFRKDALGLQEKRDFLLMSIDLIKSNDLLQSMTESEREEITCYIQRVNSRLSTVELNVRTVRDHSQEDSLSQINALIDMMITMGDPVMSRQRCQQYLNSCCSSAETGTGGGGGHHISYAYADTRSGGGIDVDAGPVDKKFESALLGCTLDDQKNIKKRLQALMGYLNKQTIRN